MPRTRVSSLLKNKSLSSNVHWIESALDEVMTNDNQREYAKRTYFRPSSAHWCQRCLWYQMMGYPESPIEPLGLRRLGIGTAYHEFIQERLARTNLIQKEDDIEREVFNDDPPMRGFVDGIITNPDTGTEYVLELKSRNENTNYAKKAILPSQDHLIQWNLYSYMTEVEQGFIMYINKGNQNYNIFEVERNENILQPTLDKFRLVWDAIQNDEHVPFVECVNRFDPFREISERDYFLKNE